MYTWECEFCFKTDFKTKFNTSFNKKLNKYYNSAGVHVCLGCAFYSASLFNNCWHFLNVTTITLFLVHQRVSSWVKCLIIVGVANQHMWCLTGFNYIFVENDFNQK